MIQLDKDNFETQVLKWPEKTLVFFTGEGWAPCEAIKPFVAVCNEKYGDKIRFASLDTAKAKRLALSQKVMSLPTIAMYEGGQKVDSILKDGIAEKSIEAFIQRHI